MPGNKFFFQWNDFEWTKLEQESKIPYFRAQYHRLIIYFEVAISPFPLAKSKIQSPEHNPTVFWQNFIFRKSVPAKTKKMQSPALKVKKSGRLKTIARLSA
jgi:hypothetical protein